jgi:hypothetical protein
MRWITFQYRLDFGRDGENVGVGLAESGSAPTPQQAFYPSKLFCAAERAARHSLRNVLASAEAHLHREETYGGIATSSLKIEMQCEPTENKAGALGKTPVQHHRLYPTMAVFRFEDLIRVVHFEKSGAMPSFQLPFFFTSYI